MKNVSKSGDPADRVGRKLYDFQQRFEDYMGKAVRSRNRYCQCGFPLWVQETWDGTDWERVVYDADHQERLVVCPGCRADLAGVQMKSSPPRDIT